MPQDQQKDIARIHQIYAALIASFMLSFVPAPVVQIIALLFFMGVFLILYAQRKASSPQSLLYNHTTFLIRTIWIGGILIIIGTVLGFVYFLASVGMDEFSRFSTIALSQEEPQDMSILLLDRYPSEMTVAALAAFLPATCYFIYRITKGLTRAVKGYRIAKPLSWF